MDSILREWSGVCPHCNNPITYTEVQLHIENDKGKVVVTCDECHNELLLNNILNAEFLTVHSGGRIVEYKNEWEIENNEQFWPKMKCIKDTYLFDNNSSGFLKKDIFVDLFENRILNPFLDYSKEPLYKCTCGQNLEKLSYDVLKNLENTGEIGKHYDNSWIAQSKNWLLNADKIIIEIDIVCSCYKQYITIMYTHMFLYAKPPELDHFLIANIFNAESQYINGVYSKDICKSYVEKYALRWNLLSIRNFAATAFIGNQYQKTNELEKLWKDLCFCFPQEKSLLVTKSKTKSSFEKRLNENGKLDHQYKYGRVDRLQENSFKYERSHAKFYAGVIYDFVEILSGSFNFSSGPSLENLSHSRISIERFKKNYLHPYGLKYEKPDNIQHFYYKSFGKRAFSDGYTILREELCSRVFML